MSQDYNKNKIFVRLAIKTPEINRALEEIVATLDEFEVQEDEKATHADVLVLEVGYNLEKEFETVRSLLKDGVVDYVFLTSAKTTTDILLPALQTGAKHFFQQPLVYKEVKKAFIDLCKEREAAKDLVASKEPERKPGKLISVLGAKGGVGTTSVAVNLAVSLNRLYPDKTVALVDMNRLLGEITVFLDLQTEFSWDELATNINRLDAAFLSRALIQYSPGLYVMPAPNRIKSDTMLSEKVMAHVLETTKNSFDFVVVDTGTHVDDLTFKILTNSDRILVISILSLPCVINIKRLLQVMMEMGQISSQKIKIIANRFEKKSAITLEKAEKLIGQPIFSSLPNDYQKTLEAINAGKPLVKIDKKCPFVKSLNVLAQSMANDGEQMAKRKGWLW